MGKNDSNNVIDFMEASKRNRARKKAESVAKAAQRSLPRKGFRQAQIQSKSHSLLAIFNVLFFLTIIVYLVGQCHH